MDVGAHVRVTCARGIRLRVENGAPEEVVFTSSSSGSSSGDDACPPQSTASSTSAEVVHSSSSDRTNASSAAAAVSNITPVPPFPADASLVTIAIPERYCSVTASTTDGDVDLANVKEADVDVRAWGRGSVTLGNVQGAQRVSVATEAGDVVARNVAAAEVTVAASAGRVDVKKLVALDGFVECGGSLALGSVYGKRARIATTRGPLAIGLVDCEVDCTIVAQEGGANIEGASGCATLDVGGGGTAAIHLNRDARRVAIVTDGPAIRISLEPGASALLLETQRGEEQAKGEEDPVPPHDVVAGEGIEATRVIEPEPGTLVSAAKEAGMARRSGGREEDPHEPTRVTVAAAAANAEVSFSVRSWLAGLKSRAGRGRGAAG